MSLHLTATELLLGIENDTRAAEAAAPRQGLRSMLSCAATSGGTLAAGPLPAGRWQVLLRVPRLLA